ncbi:MAG TPA: sigma-54-dependent Fis family transcriptional regulator [Allosphingosinicella sp.]|nr:sigma-54-dependent Fis family transcriptional regulator [Allosphingosinicella sp.]
MAAAQIREPAEGSDTMRAWELFLTGGPRAAVPVRNFVVASWMRSRSLGIDPTGRAAPLAARGGAIEALHRRHRDLIAAASGILGEAAALFDGSGSILLLTNASGVVLEALGDGRTLEEGQGIHLMQGGDWRESVIGTNGIGTAIATGRPAQVHAAEHFCEGIKSWTCAASPIREPGGGELLGIIDVSGPPSTYQRHNLTLAVATARQIEMALAERVQRERTGLLEACLERLSAADAAGGMMVIDRKGRLVHSTGRARALAPLGQLLPDLGPDPGAEMGEGAEIESWAERLPEGLRPEWFSPVRLAGETIGALVVIPPRPRPLARGRAAQASETDPRRSGFAPIVGQSPALRAALARARQLVGKRVSVLIDGETGVGKELFARAIHGEAGGERPFIAYSCGAAAGELVASDLFGHVRGAYTGATSEGRPGRFELADGGTLCLDEIGELPLDLQPMLLRVLEEWVVYRLGDPQPRRVEVRLLALTNRDLAAEVAAGRFRRDLYYRISAMRLRVPPLRERREDIDLLVAHFNEVLARRHEVPPRRFTADALAALREFDWPGNVRELRNVIETLLLSQVCAPVRREDVRAALPAEVPPAAPPHAPSDGAPLNLDHAEKAAIHRALDQAGGNVALAARALGISRSTLYRKGIRYGITL